MSGKKEITQIEILNQEDIYTPEYRKKIASLIQDQVIAKSNKTYHSIKVIGITKGEGIPDLYLIHLQDAQYYSYSQQLIKIVDNKKVNMLDSDYSPAEHPDVEKKLEAIPTGASEQKKKSTDEKASAGDEKKTKKTAADPDTDFFIGTMMPAGSPAAKAAASIAVVAKAAGYHPHVVIGSKATKEVYKKMFVANLKAFINIGHGSTKGIMTSDGSISYTWFNALDDSALNPEVVYFNSCETYNNPLWSAVATHGSRTYVAGIIKLAIGPSDLCTEGFWKNVLHATNPEKMLDSMDEANEAYNSKTGSNKSAFGLVGDGELFA